MRHVAAALLVLVAACSDSTADSVVDAATTVEAWLASFDGAESPGTFVIDQQVTLLAALGRGEQATDIVAAGLTAETEADFWESFAATVERVAGTAMGELSVTAVDVVPVDGVDHSYVRLSGPSGSTTVIVEPGGSIDMLAMTGPGLVRPLRSLLVVSSR